MVFLSFMRKGVNSNVGWETSFSVSVAFTPATLPSKQTAQVAAEHQQEVTSEVSKLIFKLTHLILINQAQEILYGKVSDVCVVCVSSQKIDRAHLDPSSFKSLPLLYIEVMSPYSDYRLPRLQWHPWDMRKVSLWAGVTVSTSFLINESPFGTCQNCHCKQGVNVTIFTVSRIVCTEPIGYSETGYSDKSATVTVLIIPKLCIC